MQRLPRLMLPSLRPMLRVDDDHATLVAAPVVVLEQADADEPGDHARRFALRETHGRSAAAGLRRAWAARGRMTGVRAVAQDPLGVEGTAWPVTTSLAAPASRTFDPIDVEI